MTRRSGRRGARVKPGGGVTISSVLPLTAGRPYFSAARYLEDPGNPGFVLRFIDWIDSARYLEQTDPAKQVAIPTAQASFAGQPCANFTGTQWYDANTALANWAFASDGVNVELYVVYSITSAGAAAVQLATTGAAGTHGMRVGYSGGGANVLIQQNIANAGSLVVNDGAELTPTGTPTYNGFSTLAGVYTRWERSVGTAVAATPPYPVSPGAPLRLGANGAGASTASMRWAATPFFPVLGGSRGTWQQYVRRAYGIPP